MTTTNPTDARTPARETPNHLNQLQLSRRWAISPRTLERWRWTGEGPRYVKLVGRILYRLEDVEAFENARLHDSTSQPVHPGSRATDPIR